MARAESSAQLCNFTTPVGGIRSRISHAYCIRSTIARPETTPPVRNHIKTRPTVRLPLDRDRAHIRDWPQNKGGRLQGGADAKVLPKIRWHRVQMAPEKEFDPDPRILLAAFCARRSVLTHRKMTSNRWSVIGEDGAVDYQEHDRTSGSMTWSSI
jgi:hypothetical protein